MKTAVVILNWNTEGYLRRFLPSVVESCTPDACVVVADSGSSDGSLKFLAEEFPEVRIVALGENLGFAGGYNRALKDMDAEYYVLLNSDVEVAPGWLEPLVGWMDTHPRCGACGPVLHMLADPSRFEYAGAAGGRLDRFGFPFCRGRVLSRTEKDFGQYGTPCEVAWVSGACMMVRSDVWRALGGFDDRFFAHMEEIDLCWRMALDGYGISVIPSCKVRHLGGGTLPAANPLKLKLNYRNSLWMLQKNLPLTVGRRKALFRIRIRMVIDRLCGLAYLVSGHPERRRAVLEAHREALPLELAPGDAVRKGIITEINILPNALLRGPGVFKYLRKYENSH